jgi:hypothetical protein
LPRSLSRDAGATFALRAALEPTVALLERLEFLLEPLDRLALRQCLRFGVSELLLEFLRLPPSIARPDRRRAPSRRCRERIAQHDEILVALEHLLLELVDLGVQVDVSSLNVRPDWAFRIMYSRITAPNAQQIVSRKDMLKMSKLRRRAIVVDA